MKRHRLMAGVVSAFVTLVVVQTLASQNQTQIVVEGQGGGTPAPAGQDTAQTPKEFEVASVKPNKAGGPGSFVRIDPATGRFNASNFPLRLLIRNAYLL